VPALAPLRPSSPPCAMKTSSQLISFDVWDCRWTLFSLGIPSVRTGTDEAVGWAGAAHPIFKTSCQDKVLA
jgi:hypothetical protein